MRRFARPTCIKDLEKALHKLEQQPIEASTFQTFASILLQCGNAKALSHGKRVHELILTSGYRHNTLLKDHLVQMYGKCGDLKQARAVFDTLPRRNVFSWNFMIGVYTRMRLNKLAIDLFKEMQGQGMEPDSFTLSKVFGACSSLGDLAEGRAIHARIVAHGLQLDSSVQNALLSMYAKCGRLEEACSVFEKIDLKRVSSWTTMIAAYAQNGHPREALELYGKMVSQGVQPDEIAFASALSACSTLAECKAVHEGIAVTGFDSNLVVENALLRAYGKCGSVDDARLVFRRMQQRDDASWNSMVLAYAQHGHSRDALDLYHKMASEGVQPQAATLTALLDACSNLRAFNEGREIHRQVSTKFHLEVDLEVAIFRMYARCGKLDVARMLFDRILRKNKNITCWNAMIHAYVEQGLNREALDLYELMDLQPNEFTIPSILAACSSLGALEKGKLVHDRIKNTRVGSDVIVQNALAAMYAKCGRMDAARELFENIPSKTVASWNTMITAYAQQGHSSKAAIHLYEEMNSQGVEPNSITYAGVLGACARLEALEKGRAIHACIESSKFWSDVVTQTALVKMYAKCGSVDAARRVFDGIKRKSVVPWNAMLGAYAQNGYPREALELYREMDVEPSEVTYATVLSACSSLESLEEGKAIHDRAHASGFESHVLVQNSLISMYSKCGRLDVANNLFDKTGGRTVVSWTAMIAAYAQRGHGKRALDLVDKMYLEGLVPDEITFMAILIACSHAGLPDHARFCFNSMAADHGITPSAELYVCMIDLLGRAGRLEAAEDLLNSMPFQPSNVAWTTFLGACKTHGDEMRARRAAEQVAVLDSKITAPYLLVSSLYTSGDACAWP